MGEASSEFKHADSIKFEELVASLGLDYEEGYSPTLHKLVSSSSYSPDELEARQNQST